MRELRNKEQDSLGSSLISVLAFILNVQPALAHKSIAQERG